MLVLDTNVISETMRQQPDPNIIAWLDSYPSADMWTTSVTVFEILTGIARLEDGTRKRTLRKKFEDSLAEDFHGRILDFDSAAATASAEVAAHLYGIGAPVEIRDLQIIGCVRSRQATLATRNVKDFRNAEIRLINPWDIRTLLLSR